MAITLVQSISNQTTNSSPANLVFTTTVSTGDLIIVDIDIGVATPGSLSVSDNVNGAYNQGPIFTQTSGTYLQTWWVVATGTGKPGVTISWTGGDVASSYGLALSGFVGTPTLDPTLNVNVSIANVSSVIDFNVTGSFANEVYFVYGFGTVKGYDFGPVNFGWSSPSVAQVAYKVQVYNQTMRYYAIMNGQTAYNCAVIGIYDAGALAPAPLANVIVTPNTTINVNNGVTNIASIFLTPSNLNLAYANANTQNIDLQGFYANVNDAGALFATPFAAANISYVTTAGNTTITVNSVGGLFTNQTFNISAGDTYSVLQH